MDKMDWPLLDRYLAGDGTPEEREEIERQLGDMPASRELLADLRAALAVTEHTAEPGRAAEVLASLRREWGEPVAEPAPSRRPSEPLRLVPRQAAPRWQVIAKIAAAVVVAAGAGMLGGQALRSPERAWAPAGPMGIAVSTARGERRTLTLSDGTIVMLAPASALRWSPDYGEKDRQVELVGEAVFTVIHDEKRPFAVLTAHSIARDLGTRFVVRAYPDEVYTDVVVAEGIVAASPRTSSEHADSVVLERGDRATLTPEGGMTVSRDVPLDDYFAWATGRLIFRDLPFRDVAHRLERWYDIDIRYDTTTLGDRAVTAQFQDEAGVEAVRVVAALLGLRLSHTGRVYTLQAQ